MVYVELPSVGKAVEKGGEAAVVESVKAASEVYAPVSGGNLRCSCSSGPTSSSFTRDFADTFSLTPTAQISSCR